MASSSSSPSLPVVSSQSWNYDVFLSFRGEDTRKTFVDHLYSALDQNGIYTYKDDVTLPQGQSISPALLKAIEESQAAVIIFSKNYVNSTWCLDELTHIMSCRDQRKQIVMPIFYDVEPTEVRKQKGKYKEAFDKHELENKNKIISWGQAVMNDPWGWLYAPLEENRKYREVAAKQELENKEKVESWRKALVQASNISGWEIKQIANGHESQGIKQIVDEISRRLNLVPSRENENLIGITTRVQVLKSELRMELGGVRMIGIWGVGGGGKTTLASRIYDEISGMYDGCCFVDNIRVESSNNGLKKLQENIILGILKEKQVQEVRSVKEGRRMIMARLRRKKVLIVLDDVDQLDQLKALVGSHDWFGDGSRILITTRDEHLLTAHGVDVIHHISLLSKDEAVKLFHNHAHRDFIPEEDFKQLSKEVVSYAGGLPLALTVLGSFLCDKDISQWKSALARMKEIPEEDIIGKLRISVDGLKAVEKDLFLEIACFFRLKKKDRAMKLFDACGFHSVIGLEVLRQKALIVTNKYGEFDMHDLVQEMGHYIVREKYPRNPEKHSRIWKREDVRRILSMDETTNLDNIEAIYLEDISYEESQRFLVVAANMNKLRWIDLRVDRLNNESSDEFHSSSDEESSDEENNEHRDEIILPLPETFPPKELYCLIIRGSIPQKKLWEGYKYLPNLTYMELGDMRNLTKIPDFSGLPNLETFKLDECPRLIEIHPPIGLLERLVFIFILKCERLRMFPSITQIKKLETLKFRGCDGLEIILEGVDNLSHLHLDDIGKEIASCTSPPPSPPGVEYCLSRGFRLYFSHSALRKLDLSGCDLGDKEIGSSVWELPNLEKLNLSFNRLISRLDFSTMRLPKLKCLKVLSCNGLVELLELPSSICVVLAEGCTSLKTCGDISNCKRLWKVSFGGFYGVDQHHIDTLTHSMLQANASENHFFSVLLPQDFPSRFVGRLFLGTQFRVHLPDDWYNDYCGFLICIVTNHNYPYSNMLIKQEDPPSYHQQRFDEVEEPIPVDCSTYLGYVSFNSLRHTTLLTSSYNIISVTIKDMDVRNYNPESRTYGGIELIPGKSSDEVQTTDWSDHLYNDTFTIQQCDSESSIEITWKPYNFLIS